MSRSTAWELTTYGLLVDERLGDGFVVKLVAKKECGTGSVRWSEGAPMMSFHNAVMTVRDYACKKGLWDNSAGMVWDVSRMDRGTIPELTGPSMGLAFALAFAKLHIGDGGSRPLGRELERWVARIHSEFVAATGEVDNAGEIHKVAGIKEKLKELLVNRNCYHILTLLVAEDQYECFEPADRELKERLCAGHGGVEYKRYRRDGARPLVVVPARNVPCAFKKLFQYQGRAILEI